MNYQNKLIELVNSLTKRPKLLLHSCCGPCSTTVLSFLKDYFDITVLYYNPNIEPITVADNAYKIYLLAICNLL